MLKITKIFAVLATLFALTTTFSCNNNIECSFDADQDVITKYLADNNLTATKTESGLHYIIEKEGLGTLYPNINSTVGVKYKGYFTDGVVFDENAQGTEFTVGQVIAGWQEGLTLMKKQSKAQFFIPSSLAYGSRAVGGMEGRECSVIIFDVELDDFQ